MMKTVLFLGSPGGTSGHRAAAFKRLGFAVTVLDPAAFAPRSRWAGIAEWKLAPEAVAWVVKRRLLEAVAGQRFDLVFVDSGSLVSRGLLQALRRQACHLVNYNHDDPFGPRDWVRFRAYRAAVSAYDLVVVVRQPNVAEAKSCGARDVLLTYRTADVIAHQPLPLPEALRARWASDVLFVGTWMGARGQFLLELMAHGVQPAIYGNSWQKAPEWPQLRGCWRGPGVDGDDYCHAIQSAKICLGFLSKDNRDLHTTRSLEVPRLGGLFCAERTAEHQALYAEGIEAVYWRDAAECAAQCLRLLADEPLRQRIAAAGQRRALQDSHTNDALILKIIDRLNEKTASA